MVSVMGSSAELFATVGVGDRQGKKANGCSEEDQVGHALVPSGFDTKPWRWNNVDIEELIFRKRNPGTR